MLAAGTIRASRPSRCFLCRSHRPDYCHDSHHRTVPALDHPADELREAIVKRLNISDADLLNFSVFKRSYDARKKNSVILFIYILDVEVRDEAAVPRALPTTTTCARRRIPATTRSVRLQRI